MSEGQAGVIGEAQARIEEGSVTFWLKPGKVDFRDNNAVPLLQLNPPGGSMLLVKDSDRKIKFFHVYLGKGRTDLEYDVAGLDPATKHMFAVTWSVQDKKIVLYVDGSPVAEASIAY